MTGVAESEWVVDVVAAKEDWSQNRAWPPSSPRETAGTLEDRLDNSSGSGSSGSLSVWAVFSSGNRSPAAETITISEKNIGWRIDAALFHQETD